MPTSPSNISTIVRSIFWTAVRCGFLLGSRLAPASTVRRAGQLFCTPLAGTRERALALPLSYAHIAQFQYQDHTVATYVWGEPAAQPYVLFAHGWSSCGGRIQPWVAPLMAAGYAVVGFDQIAHGRSSGGRNTLPGFTDLLLAVAQRHGPAAAVIGHSLGGAASALALARGLRADRAILIAPAADPIDATHRFARLVWLAEHLCLRMFTLYESRLGVTFEEQQAHRFAHRIARPALIVHDLEDREVPWAEGERYARCWPGARLLSTAGLGHRRIVDDASVIEAGLRFLQGKSVGERVVSSPNLPFGVG